jgi:molecular chaperone DnaK
MARTTIDYGIDLGTTNSTVALLVGTAPEVISNKDGSSITPSALWFDKRGKMYVGRDARARQIDDEENAAVEFKLRMGEQWQKTFQRTGRKMLPEEMSAEVLKSLKTDVHTSKGEDLRACVITVPAAFELQQCEATRRAAELAGFLLSPLLQEPVAAALAYGFQSAANKVFWLVYDFGGGTFDAAVIQVRDGVIQVVNHAGDNYLGGKNIDWDIVEKLLIPNLKSTHKLASFPDNRNTQDHRWKSALAKLKFYAEEAKIQVSRTKQSAEICVDGLCEDDQGNTVDFACELQPAEVQRIIEPWVTQSVNLCKKALREKGLSGKDIEKTILVGGSSLFPWLQERVAGEIGAKLDFSIDPITVVARGAAVFAGTQRLDADQGPVAAGAYKIQLEYEPVGSETDPMVGGRITPPPGASTTGLSVEIIEQRSQWRSGAIRISATGTFMTEVHAEKGRKCEFQIMLMDARGTRLSCSPDRFAYTVGMVITSPPLTHNLGIAMSNNKPKWFFHKGDALPARNSQVLFNVVALRKGQPQGKDNIIKIPVVEGTNDNKADRNRLVGHLEILPTDPRVKRDVPLGSEIEVTIEIDASRTAKSKAFIPILDEDFEGIFKLGVIAKSPDLLRQELASEVSRLEALKGKAEDVSDRKAKAVIERMEQEQAVDTVRRQVAAAQGDPDARGEADRKLLDLKAAIDSVEGALEWPGLVLEAHRQLDSTREDVEAHGQPEEKQRLQGLANDIERAIAEERVELLRTRIEDVRDLGGRIVVRQPGFWVGYLDYLEQRRSRMRDQAASDRLFTQAQRAINSNDIEALKAAVRQLIALLPPDEQEAAEARGGFGGTIIAQ